MMMNLSSNYTISLALSPINREMKMENSNEWLSNDISKFSSEIKPSYKTTQNKM